MTLSSISQIDRQDKNLQSTIDIISVNKRVRTCIIKSKTLTKNLLKKEKKVDIPETEECKVDYESDNSLDDKKLAEIKNEMVNEKPREDEMTNVNDEISTEEKALLDIEDDRMFSDDEDSRPHTNEVDKTVIKEEISVEEQVSLNTEQAESDKIVINKNHKDKRKKRVTKFEVYNPKINYLDPNHWLKINLTEEEALEEFRARALDRKYLSAAYKCSVCYKGFSKEDMLNRHIKLRHSEVRRLLTLF